MIGAFNAHEFKHFELLLIDGFESGKIYSFFRPKTETAKHVRLENSVECPDNEGILFKHITNFAGRAGGINHVINVLGDPINVGERTYYEAFVGGNGN